MSRPQEPHCSSFPFGNPFRMMLPRSSVLNSKLRTLLNGFEESLAERLRKLKLTDGCDSLTLSWMLSAIESLCEIHKDIKTLIAGLELPVCDWDEKWIDLYLDDSVKLLDICNAFSSELSRLSQAHVHLQCALHSLDSASPGQFLRASSSLDGWRQLSNSKSFKLGSCCAILDDLMKTSNLPKVKNSARGKVLMRAMYGVKVSTVFVCAVFVSAFSGSPKNLEDLRAPGSFLWAGVFTDVQANVHGGIRVFCSRNCGRILKEVENVDADARKLSLAVRDEDRGCLKNETIKECVAILGRDCEELSHGLDEVARKVNDFFQIVLTGRDALLSNLRGGEGLSELLGEIYREGLGY